MITNKLRYWDIINNILEDNDVKENINFLFSETNKDPLSTNYFGINYSKDEFKSLKIYFSIASFFPENTLKYFGINQKYIDLIKQNWEPSKKLEYIHQGLTFGLKCYLIDGKVNLNKYFHFRTKNSVKNPSLIEIEQEELKNIPGICVEFHNDLDEIKYYYYLYKKESINKILKMFKISNILNENEISAIEYTESNIEIKINILHKQVSTISKCIHNEDIIEISKFFYENYGLYYQGAGFRKNKDVRSIYYIPKKALYETYPFKSFSLIRKLT